MRKNLRKQSEYIALRRNIMLSMGFCSECSRFNDLFPFKCCSRCKDRKKERHLNNGK
jgi:hypothetical protein